VEPDVAAVAARIDRHEAICIEQAKAVSLSLSLLQAGHVEITAKLDDLNRTAWRMVAAVALPMLGLMAWFFVQVWPTSGARAVTQQNVATATADRYTAHDAARDREMGEARDRALLEAIQRLRR